MIKMRYNIVANTAAKTRVPGVVEEAAVPEAVLPSGRRVEETGVGAIELVEAVLCVLWGVAMNDIQQHRDAHRMSRINQLLQFIWGPIPTAETQPQRVCVTRGSQPSPLQHKRRLRFSFVLLSQTPIDPLW